MRGGITAALLLVLVMLSNCQSAGAMSARSMDVVTAVQPPPDLIALRRELLRVDSSFSATGAALSLIESIVAPLDSDAIFIAPGPGFLRGPEQVRQALSGDTANRTAGWRWSVIRADVSNDGTHGYTYGYTTQELADGQLHPGKYHAYWKRSGPGEWRMLAYKRTPSPPGTVSMATPDGFGTPAGAEPRRVPPPMDDGAELEALFAVDRAFSAAASSGLAAAFAAYAAVDGAQTGTSPQWAFGPREIYRAYQDGDRNFTWSPEMGHVAASGDLGFTVGYVRSGSAIVGKYLTIWQKQTTGGWKYIVD